MSNKKQRVILKFSDDSFVQQLQKLLVQAGKVKVTGLGVFELRRIEQREGYNVGSGGRITIPAHNKIVFRPTKAFKDLVQGNE